MKKQVISEQHVCDICGEWCYDGCLGCGVDHCYDHRKKLGVGYGHSVYRQGTGDGYYCHECDKKLRASGDDPLHTAYLEMQALREENTTRYEDIEKRNAKLSLHIKVLYDKRRYS